jgi:WD40 repeat protein
MRLRDETFVTGETERVEAAEILVGPATDEVAHFRAAVAREGVVLRPMAEASLDLPLVVIVTALEMPDERMFQGRTVLPVSFLPVASLKKLEGTLGKLSHSKPRALGEAKAAANLAQAVRFGAHELVAWERLSAAAIAWATPGKASSFLGGAAQASARVLLASDRPAQHPEDARAIAAYVEASTLHTRRRRRVWESILGAAALVLVSATVVAVIQANSAIVAGRYSTDAANAAEARRLTSEAVGLLATDPDLPLILGAEASRLSDAPEVRTAVASIAGTQIPHTAAALVGAPRQIVSSPSGRLAYTSFDGREVHVIDTAGVELAAFPYLESDEELMGAAIALSPDGRAVAVDTEDGVQLFDVATGEEVQLKGTWNVDSDALLSWWDEGHLLVRTASGAALQDLTTGKRDDLTAGEGLGPVRAAALSPDGEWLAVSDQEKVQVWELATRTLRHDAEVTDVTDVAVANGGEVIVGAHYPHLVRVEFGDDEPRITEDDDDVATVGVVALPSGHFAGSGRDGRVSIYSDEAGVAGTVSRFRAHRGDTVRIAALPGGGLASVGLDGYLRVWDTRGLEELGSFTELGPQSVSAQADSITTEEFVEAVFPSVSLRNQVVSGDDGVLGVALQDSYGVALLVDAHDPGHSLGGMGLGTFSRAFLLRDGSGFVNVSGFPEDGGSNVEVLRRTGDQWSDDPDTQFTMELPYTSIGVGPFLATVDGHGDVAVATVESLTVVSADGVTIAEHSYRVPATPAALWIGPDGVAEVVTDDGIRHSSEGIETDLLPLLPETAGGAIAAAEFMDAALWLLTDRGALALLKNDEVRMVAGPGTLTGAGTLRISPDGDTVAHLGANAVTLLRASDGAVIARQANPYGVTVDDLAFGVKPLTAHVITSVGSVALWDLDAALDDEPAPGLQAPREATEAERLAFGMRRQDG